MTSVQAIKKWITSSEGNPNACVCLLINSRPVRYIWLMITLLDVQRGISGAVEEWHVPSASVHSKHGASPGVTVVRHRGSWVNWKERQRRDRYNLGLVAKLLLIRHGSSWRRRFTAPPGGDSPGSSDTALKTKQDDCTGCDKELREAHTLILPTFSPQ